VGDWARNLRAKKDTLSPERIERLNQLGYRWDLLAGNWEVNFAALERFKQREGHCRVPQGHQEDGLELPSWVWKQRKGKKTLSPEQIERLNQLGFRWDPLAGNWEINFAALERFKQREGHCHVATSHQEDGLKLGAWVSNQRAAKNKLSPERIERLNQLGFRWDPLAENWESHFAALERFYQREGHCRVATSHQEDGLKLGAWVSKQRTAKNKLSPERIERLNQLGFSWNPLLQGRRKTKNRKRMADS
jgi:uncharacterized cupin superfamily protein